VLEAEEKIRGDMYIDLLGGAVDSEEYVSVRARQLDISLYGSHCVIEVIPNGGLANKSESARAGFGLRLQNIVSRACGQYALKSAVIPRSEGYLIVLHFLRKTKPEAFEAQIRAVCTALWEQLSALPDINELFVGVGEVQESLTQLALSCRQAGRAIALGRKISGNGGLFFFGQMGIYSLVDAKSMEEFHENCCNELEQFTEKCGANAAIYLDTLEAYFDSGENLTAMASALGLHLNTVRYRMKKISEIMGAGFFKDGKEKMRLYLLIKMQKII
jgi:purine catabolism regulator